MVKSILINEIVRSTRLDNLWKETFIKGRLSFIEAQKLSQLTNQHLARLLRSRSIPYYIEDDKKFITGRTSSTGIPPEWYSRIILLEDPRTLLPVSLN